VSRFRVLCSQSNFPRYRGRHVPFSCFARLDSFSEESEASGPVFMFCAPDLIFGDNDGVGSRFHVLCSQSRFPRYRGRRVQFSCFALPDSFSAVPWASGPVLMFCSLGLIFGDIEGDGFHFRRYRGRRVLFSYLALSDSVSAIPGAMSLVFMFCAPGVVSRGTEGVGSRFHVLRSRTHFRRYQGCRVPFSCIALSDSFSVVPRASDPVFMFCAPRLVFGGTEGVGSHFHVLRARTHF
jgi:hypothetical protein